MLTVISIALLAKVPESTAECDVGKFSCANEECVNLDRQCDGYNDCGDYSDEENCECNDDEFTCTNGHCIPSDHICDADNDCGDRSDEINCYGNINETCVGGYLCVGTGQCLPESFNCDGDQDCDDGADEDGCSVISKKYNTKIVHYYSYSFPEQ